MRSFSGCPTPQYTGFLHRGNVLFGVQTGMNTVDRLGKVALALSWSSGW